MWGRGVKKNQDGWSARAYVTSNNAKMVSGIMTTFCTGIAHYGKCLKS